MKKKFICGVLVLCIMAGAGIPVSFAEDDLITQEGMATQDASASGVRSVIEEPAEENDFDPSEFEGDSEAMPGERAPEELPMSDEPAEAGIAIE